MFGGVFENLSGWKKFLPTELVKTSVRKVCFSGVLNICQKPESIQYTYRKLSTCIDRNISMFILV